MDLIEYTIQFSYGSNSRDKEIYYYWKGLYENARHDGLSHDSAIAHLNKIRKDNHLSKQIITGYGTAVGGFTLGNRIANAKYMDKDEQLATSIGGSALIGLGTAGHIQLGIRNKKDKEAIDKLNQEFK